MSKRKEPIFRKDFTSTPIKRPRRQNNVSKKMVRSPIHENKYFDLAGATYEFSTTGSITQINVVPVGNTQITRLGKKIQLKSVQVRGRIVAGTTGNLADAALLVVYDKRPQSGASLAAITDILNTIAAASMNNADNEGRFKILYRKDFTITGNSTGAAATGQEIQDGDFYLNLRGLPTVYKSVGTGDKAGNDVEEGVLYMVTVGNIATGTGAPNLIGNVRLRFTE